MTSYERAVQSLAQASPKDFVRERRRIAAELRRHDKEAAARVEIRRKPTASVWAVNQLYWTARSELEALLTAAASLHRGDVSANREYRAALAALRESATVLLRREGLGAADATLRKVATTLSALGAAGGFAPYTPGALEHDLDAPGFDAIGRAPTSTARPRPAKRSREQAPARSVHDDVEQHRARERERVRRERAERRKEHRAAAARRLELRRLERARAVTARAAAAATRRIETLEKQLREARERARRTEERIGELDRRIAGVRDQR